MKSSGKKSGRCREANDTKSTQSNNEVGEWGCVLLSSLMVNMTSQGRSERSRGCLCRISQVKRNWPYANRPDIDHCKVGNIERLFHIRSWITGHQQAKEGIGSKVDGFLN